ncbi:MAG: hypothetical protein Q9184_007508, partial [Pyrenodesmia sp. 2 TL-2023]
MASSPSDDGWVVTVRVMRTPNPTPEELRWIELFVNEFNIYRAERLNGRSTNLHSYIEEEIRKAAG